MESNPSGLTTIGKSSVIVGNSSLEEGIALGNISDTKNLQQQQQQQQPHHLRTTSLIQQAQQQSTTPSPIVSPSPKIVGKNYNNTMVTTSTPTNEAELQLYRVLQRASLLIYYDTLLEMGGDDVQQLYEAGEEEFLEIMALVGMASKPLHVRRLQKSLHEWANNPSMFQTPLSSSDSTRSVFSPEPGNQSRSPFGATQPYSPSSLTGTSSASFSHLSSMAASSSPSMGSINQPSATSSTLPLTPTLTDIQMARLASAAETLARGLPLYTPKPPSSKKRSSKDLEQVMAMSECDPRRMDEIRKYAAIYGRFDCKRNPGKPLTLHEVCVNEAAAQICKFVPTLLTIRDKLFPLARKAVRDAGLGHSSGMSSFQMNQSSSKSSDHEPSTSKRMRLGSDTSSDYTKESTEEMRQNLLSIYQKLGKTFEADSTKFSSNYARSEYDDTDSRFSFSNSSSPLMQTSPNGGDLDQQNVNDATDEDNKNTQLDLIRSPESNGNMSINPLGVHVISASASHIIAVANPALALSNSMLESVAIKRERMSPDL